MATQVGISSMRITEGLPLCVCRDSCRHEVKVGGGGGNRAGSRRELTPVLHVNRQIMSFDLYHLVSVCCLREM